MGALQKNILRALAASEQQQLERLVKTSSERLDVVRRAKALLTLTDGCMLTEARKQADLFSLLTHQ
ncbi:MAG TPA: hypothetical protein VFV38_02350 [Ktedonobacteraceae bacterium]|nr:hypothetical protein [Ktedonobacteraceae bacterium]